MSSARAPIILASASPRRRELLSQAGVVFEIRVPGCDETPVPGEAARDMVERLALMKASVIADACPEAYVIGADTTVCINNQCLGKPVSQREAQDMLATIQGKTHNVWGGIAVVSRRRGLAQCWSHVTEVTMCPMDKSAIEAYVKTGEPMDKAGAYAIQGLGLQFVNSIRSSYSNVVGLNIASLMSVLRGFACL